MNHGAGAERDYLRRTAAVLGNYAAPEWNSQALRGFAEHPENERLTTLAPLDHCVLSYLVSLFSGSEAIDGQ